jgi:hypothetical protein
MELSKTFSKKLKRTIEQYNFEVGVLEDKPHKAPLASKFGDPQLSSYAGGPVQKTSRVLDGKTTGEVLTSNMDRLGLNLLWEPFKKKDAPILKFSREFLRTAMAKKSMNRVVNLLQAIVRNPILKQQYGANTSATADSKGFDRHLFGTGQMFKAIKARAKRV